MMRVVKRHLNQPRKQGDTLGQSVCGQQASPSSSRHGPLSYVRVLETTNHSVSTLICREFIAGLAAR